MPVNAPKVLGRERNCRLQHLAPFFFKYRPKQRTCLFSVQQRNAQPQDTDWNCRLKLLKGCRFISDRFLRHSQPVVILDKCEENRKILIDLPIPCYWFLISHTSLPLIW